MNMFKKNGGFTLVELIVVIAILAILAGIAIPAYTGYIAKANEAADNTTLAAVKTAAMAAYATEGEVTAITVTEGEPDTISVTVNGSVKNDTLEKTDFETYYGKDPFSFELKTGKAAVWNASGANAGWSITPDE